MAKRDRKDSILNAAETLFALHGYEGTSTRAIADRAGANLALIAYYFKSKEGVFQEVVSRRATALLDRVRVLAEPIDPPWVRLNRFIEETVQFLVAEQPEFSRILLRESTAPIGHEHTRSPMRASTRPLREVLMRIQAAGRAEGEFKYADVDLCLNMLLGVALMSAADAASQSPSELSSLSRRAAELVASAFRGLLAKGQPTAGPLPESPPQPSLPVSTPIDVQTDRETGTLGPDATFQIGEID
ncbi:MAG: TetR/AcrR family transcriptional regulator [Candidatus Hydrogenedentes bacterium]|nr:TetR/AcrR family transcriptional regulator [Candidatus Hydrogenedentota bacterium]